VRRVLVVAAAVLVAVAAVVTIAVELNRSTVDVKPVAATVASPGDPTRVTIPSIGVDASLVSVGLQGNGAMETPSFGQAGWYRPGPRPGEPGPAVIVGHVDSAGGGPDVFGRLLELRPGDRVTVHYTGAARTFVVTDLEQTAKTDLPKRRIWNKAKAPVLRLITCGGAFDRGTGHYLDNVVVYAVATGSAA
jgi:sortase (surface protein transpeptidase)